MCHLEPRACWWLRPAFSRQVLGVDADEETRNKLFDETDTDGNALIDYEEFTVLYLILLEKYETVPVRSAVNPTIMRLIPALDNHSRAQAPAHSPLFFCD